MLGKTRGSNVRVDLDAVSSCKLAGFCTLFTRFIDKEVVVTFPEKWLQEEMKTSIEALTCDGTFELHGKFNPNNLVRIALNCTQKEVSGIFLKVVLEYQVCMKKYMKGTGGGPGAPENFSTWQTQDETYVSQYTQQSCNLYLAVVDIWDKQFGFPFVPRRDPMPDNCMIDDIVNFKGGEENEDNIPEEVQARLTIPLPTRKNAARSTTSTTSSTKLQSAQKGIENVLEKMSQGREEMKEATSEILDITRRSASTRSSTSESEPHEIMDQMNKSMALIGTCRNELKKLCRKKRAIKNDTNYNKLSLKSTKRIKSILKSIKA